MNPFAQDPAEGIKKKLFSYAMKSNWHEVINIYYQNREAHNAKITRSGDSALHIAIADGQESIVEDLVSIVAETPGALETQNELGNTPLHMAAYLGSVRMCRCIATQDSKLMGIRNNDTETPFFLAALHGRKEAFLCLHNLCKEPGEGYNYCRRKDGETILHAAISGEYFDMAFQIIYLYEKLLNSVNEQGFSPLHLLASKPSAFRSGSDIRGFDKLIYHCIFIDELKLKTGHTLAQDLQYDDKARYPENYQTCVGVFILLWKIIGVLMGRSSQQQDAEDPKDQKLVHKQVGSSENRNNQKADAEEQQSGDEQSMGSSRYKAQGHEFLPKNYFKCFHFLKFISKVMLVILGLGSIQVVKIREKKEKHIWSVQIMEKLIKHASLYLYEDNGRSPHLLAPEKDSKTAPYALGDGGDADSSCESLTGLEAAMVLDYHSQPSPPDKTIKASQNNKGEHNNGTNGNGTKAIDLDMAKKETPILVAAKNGIKEMVAMILDFFPVAIHDMNIEKKNIVLLAVENRQPHVYQFLLDRKIMKETIFRKTDEHGNSALHLAARLGDHLHCLIPGAALQMQWEIKWYEFVKNSMPLYFFPRYNLEGKTPQDIFSETHKKLVVEGGLWLTNASQSCSVVAALIATVSFATSATVPGGVKSESGSPTLEKHPAFSIFAISSLIALYFSVTSVVMFVAILISRYHENDFRKVLPRKLLVGLTSLFVSMASMLVSFCAGHFIMMKDNMKSAAFPVYAGTSLPVMVFAVAQFPMYFDLVLATFMKMPRRSYE